MNQKPSDMIIDSYSEFDTDPVTGKTTRTYYENGALLDVSDGTKYLYPGIYFPCKREFFNAPFKKRQKRK